MSLFFVHSRLFDCVLKCKKTYTIGFFGEMASNPKRIHAKPLRTQRKKSKKKKLGVLGAFARVKMQT